MVVYNPLHNLCSIIYHNSVIYTCAPATILHHCHNCELHLPQCFSDYHNSVIYTCHNVSAIITILRFTLATMFQRLPQFCDLHLLVCCSYIVFPISVIYTFHNVALFATILWFTFATMFQWLSQFCNLHLLQLYCMVSPFLWFTLYYWLSTWTVWNMPLYGCGCDHICQLQLSTYKGTLPVSRTHWLQTCPPWITPA